MGGRHHIHLAQNKDHWPAIVSTAMTFRVPQNAKRLVINSVIISFRRTLLHGAC
jgi:hypothetical protein